MARRNEEMPNLFVIGAMKCGTSSLHRYLDAHSEISMSTVKEPRYFLRHVEGFELPLISDRREYLDLFESGTRYRGETSPGYSKRFSQPGVPGAIRREAVDPRFVYLVNDPVERFPSVVQQRVVSRASSVRGLYDSIDRNLDAETVTRLAGDVRQPGNEWVESGLYMTQLEAYLEVFPPDSILVVDSRELKGNRRETMGRIFEFLGLDPVFDPEVMETEHNPGERKIRDPDFYLKLVGTGAASRLKGIIPRSVREPVVNRIRKVFGETVPKPGLEEGLRAELEDLYGPEVERLRKFSGHEFQTWSI